MSQARAGEPPCANRTDLVAACFRVEGYLRLYDGTPSARISVRGTKRILGVISYFTNNNETFAAPEELRKRASFDHSLQGAFLVCPITRPKAGEMQRVCVESVQLQSEKH
jgi:hypothetical protein